MYLKKGFAIFNQTVMIAIAFLFFQQIIVASSTIWITRLIESIQRDEFSFLWLGFYLISLFFPYFPGALALVTMAKAKISAQINFIHDFTKIYLGNVLEWTSSSQQAKKSSILAGEGPQTINQFLDYIYQLSSSGLNVFLNLFVLALIIDPLFLLSYGIGIGTCFFILKWQKNHKKAFSLRAQTSRINWIEMLLKAWDHILLNNRYNFHIWKEKMSTRGKGLRVRTMKLENFSQMISIIMAFSLLLPSFFLVCFLAYFRRTDFIFLAMLVVVLPRLFQILSYSYEMLFSLSDFPMQKSQLNTVTNLINIGQKLTSEEVSTELEKRIKWNLLSVIFSNKEGSREYEVSNLFKKAPHKGRITLRGENGSGKTSFLLLLKQKYGEQAFYLPPKHNLLFHFTNEDLSTGQKAIKILKEIIQKANASIILLDEWDANLDAENSMHISQAIEEISQKLCVIESRHFRYGDTD